MSRVDGQDVNSGLNESLSSGLHVFPDADSRSDPQPPEFVLARIGKLSHLFDIFDGDQPLQVTLLINHQEFLDSILMEDFLCFLEGNAHRHSDQILVGHHRRYLLVQPRLESQIPIR